LSSLKKWCSSPTWNTNAEIPNHQTVDQKTDPNQCWCCTFWNHGLKKTPRIPPPCLFSACISLWTPRIWDLPWENAIFPNQTQHAASDCQETRPRTSTISLVCFLKKQTHPRASASRWLSTLFQSRVLLGSHLRAVDSKAFPGMWEKGGLTRIGKPPPLTDSLRTRGSRGQSPKGRACPQEMIVWRQDGGAVTCSVLNHFQGIGRLLLDFMMLTSVSWLTRVHRHLNRSREGRERLASGLPHGSPPLSYHP